MELNGFLISIHLPNEERLVVRLDCSELPPNEYLNLIANLQDLLNTWSMERSERGIRGARSLRGRYRRIEEGNIVKRRKRLEFIPLPNIYPNQLKNLRNFIYNEINRTCIKLQEFGSGRVKRCLYLLPPSKINDFLEVIKKGNEKIDAFNNDVREELNSHFFKEIMELIQKGGEVNLPPKFEIEKIEFEMLPLKFTSTVINELTREGGDGEEVKAILEEKKKALMEKVLKEFKQRIDAIIASILGEKRLRYRAKRLKELKQMAESIGLQALASSVIQPMIEFFEGDISKADLDKRREFVSGVSKRVEALIDSL